MNPVSPDPRRHALSSVTCCLVLGGPEVEGQADLGHASKHLYCPRGEQAAWEVVSSPVTGVVQAETGKSCGHSGGPGHVGMRARVCEDRGSEGPLPSQVGLLGPAVGSVPPWVEAL